MRPRTAALSIVLAAVPAAGLVGAALGAAPFSAHTSRYTGYSTTGEVPIAGVAGGRGIVRAHFVLPANWRRTGALNAPAMRFDTRNSCGHRVSFAWRLVLDADVPATERAAALTPATAPYVQASGTRERAAFRVVREVRTKNLRGILVQPLGTSGGQRLFAEITATATRDPRTECHAGGPRRVGDAIGDAFAAGSAGGFALGG